MEYEKESYKIKPEPLTVAKMVLLTLEKNNEEINLRQLQKILRELNTLWYFSKGNPLFNEIFVKNCFNEWQLKSVWDRFCGFGAMTITCGFFSVFKITFESLNKELAESNLTEEDINYLNELINFIIKEQKYKNHWGGNNYEFNVLQQN